ncbi:MAG: hypothetical protein R6U04_05010 [Bacteroidales bacterium]
MKRIKGIFVLFISVVLIFLAACEDERLNPEDDTSVLEGEWEVDEDSEFYKSTQSRYRVYISVSETDTSQVVISNFYQLGYENAQVVGEVSGKRIQLLQDQSIETQGVTYTVLSGNGEIADDYRSIDWEYEVDDGSGDVDNVTARYTRR